MGPPSVGFGGGGASLGILSPVLQLQVGMAVWLSRLICECSSLSSCVIPLNQLLTSHSHCHPLLPSPSHLSLCSSPFTMSIKPSPTLYPIATLLLPLSLHPPPAPCVLVSQQLRAPDGILPQQVVPEAHQQEEPSWHGRTAGGRLRVTHAGAVE